MNNRIEIQLSSKKISLLLIGALLFIIGGTWMVFDPGDGGYYFIIGRSFYLTPEMIQTIGVIGIVFFGIIIIYGIRKLFEKKVGLIIDSKGITDNSNASSIGLIEWNDIKKIRTEQIMSTKFLLIDIVNPEKYIEKATNRIQAKLLKTNMRIYNTPISITSNSMNCSFQELQKLILTEFERNINAS